MNNPFSKKKSTLQNLEVIRQTKTNIAKKEKELVENDITAFMQCTNCKQTIIIETLESSLYVCEKCGHHLAMPSKKRLECLFDKGKYKTISPTGLLENPLAFPGYAEKKQQLQVEHELEDAVLAGVGKVAGQTCVIACLDSAFLMGSMGVYVGETITQSIEMATEKKLPLIIFSASGGARMQEGIFALMQMAKTSAAIEQFSAQGGLYISYFTHPTTGGVSASFASLGDITLAEPNALIGFAGPRVIKETIKQELPDGFQKSEYLMKHGFIDKIVERSEMKASLVQLLTLHAKERNNVKRIRNKN